MSLPYENTTDVIKERPILFKGEMVRAILEGRKTQTRRVVKLPKNHVWGNFFDGQVCPENDLSSLGYPVDELRCPYGQTGDRLWVRETWQGPLVDDDIEERPVDLESPKYCAYAADGSKAPEFMDADDNLQRRWRPSIHMPRWASRITLEITGVRVERLQKISDANAISEGVEGHYIEDDWYWRNYRLTDEEAAVSPMLTCPRESFRSLWESISGPGSWMENPWVWVIEFKRVQP